MYRSNIIHSYTQRLLCMLMTLTVLMGSLCYSEVNGKTRPNTRPKKAASQEESKPTNERMQQFYQLPMSFELNRGQTDQQVKFLSRGSGYTLFLTATEAVLSLRQGVNQKPAVLRTSLVGANRNPQIVRLSILPAPLSPS